VVGIEVTFRKPLLRRFLDPGRCQSGDGVETHVLDSLRKTHGVVIRVAIIRAMIISRPWLRLHVSLFTADIDIARIASMAQAVGPRPRLFTGF
jgi:hypothetical protein